MARRKNIIAEPQPQDTSLPRLTLEEAEKLFLQDCKIRNLSDHTLKYYRLELRMVRRFLEEGTGQEDAAQITRADIRNHIILRMMDEEKKETSINSRLRAARALFNFLEKEGYLPHNPMEDVKLVKEKKNVIETFSTDQIRMLLRTPNRETFTGLRDFTMMMLMLETGIRLKELCGIKTHHVNIDDGYVRITEGKGYKERTVPIQKSMRKQLATYMRVRGELHHDFLFVNIDNEPIAPRQVQNRIHQYGKQAGIKNVRCSPHTFRHTFAKLSVQNGANVFELQAMLGHTSLEMVRRYVNLFSTDVAAGHAKFSPIERLQVK